MFISHEKHREIIPRHVSECQLTGKTAYSLCFQMAAMWRPSVRPMQKALMCGHRNVTAPVCKAGGGKVAWFSAVPVNIRQCDKLSVWAVRQLWDDKRETDLLSVIWIAVINSWLPESPTA